MSRLLRDALRDISAEVRVVDLKDRAVATSRRITLRRNVSLAVCGALAIVAITAATLQARPRALPGDPPPTPVPTPAPTPTALPDYQEPPAPDLNLFTGVTMTIPSWGAGTDGCRTGSLPFTQGQNYVAGEYAVNVLNHLVSDVDGDGIQDYVVHLICGDAVSYGQQIVAFHKAGTQYTPIGRVVGTQDGIEMMSEMKSGGPGRIAVWVSTQYNDGGQTLVPSQWRVYQWQSGRFRQVDGPASFPSHTPSIKLSVKAGDLFLKQGPPGTYQGEMVVTVRNDGDATTGALDLAIAVPIQLDPMGDGWAGCSRAPNWSTAIYHCVVRDLRPGSSATLTLAFIADEKPLASRQSIGIRQLPPYTYDESADSGTEFQVVL